MKRKLNFLLLSLLLLNISSCKSDSFFDNEIIDEDSKTTFYNAKMDFDFPGRDILSYEYFVQGYEEGHYLDDTKRFYNYTMNYNYKNNGYYFVYLNKNTIKKIEKKDIFIKYDSSYLNGFFLDYLKTYEDNFSLDNIKVFKNNEFKFKKSYKNYKLIAVFESSLINVKENISKKEIINRDYELLNCLRVKDKTISYFYFLDDGDYIYSCSQIDNKNYLFYPEISLSYADYFDQPYNSKIYNINNKEYIIFRRYSGDLDYLDENGEFDSYLYQDYYGKYKKEFLSAYYKRVNEKSSTGYFSLDKIKEFIF